MKPDYEELYLKVKEYFLARGGQFWYQGEIYQKISEIEIAWIKEKIDELKGGGK